MRIIGIVGIAIQHRQRDFGQLQRHAEKSDHPHPENRARPAQRDGKGDATDITETDCRGKRSGKGLKVVDGARVIGIVVDTANDTRTVGQRAILGETAPERKQYAGPDQRIQHVLVPQKAVERGEQRAEFRHIFPRFLLCGFHDS